MVRINHFGMPGRVGRWRRRIAAARAGGLLFALLLLAAPACSSGSSTSAGSGSGGSTSADTGGSNSGGTGSPGTAPGGTGTGSSPPGAMQVPNGLPTSSDHFTDVLTLATDTSGADGAANTLWTWYFANYVHKTWTPVKFTPYHDNEAVCGMTAQRSYENAFYCGPQLGIVYDIDWLRRLYNQFGDFAPVEILLHEGGHEVNDQSGDKGRRSIAEELQADCDAGYATQYIARSNLLDPGDVQEALNSIFSMRTINTPWFAPDQHGQPTQRTASFNQGFSGTMQNCIAIGQASYGPVATAGSFRVDLPDGVTTQALNGGITRLAFPGETTDVDLSSYGEANLAGSGEAASRLDAVFQQYFQGNASEATKVDTFANPNPDGTTQSIPVSSLVSQTDSIAGVTYSETLQGQTYHGLLLLVVRPGSGGLLIDTYIPGDTDNQSAYVPLAKQTLSGLE
jgi:putative neutral zinc metallopeptidase